MDSRCWKAKLKSKSHPTESNSAAIFRCLPCRQTELRSRAMPEIPLSQSLHRNSEGPDAEERAEQHCRKRLRWCRWPDSHRTARHILLHPGDSRSYELPARLQPINLRMRRKLGG